MNPRKNLFILLSILRSGDRSAYYVLWLKLLQFLARPFDLMLSTIERRRHPNVGAEPVPIVLVVGIHRSGSTFVAQMLTAALPLMPLANLAAIFPRSRYFVHRLSRSLYRPGGGARQRNFYGYATGLFGVSDCYEVWDRWFGYDHYNPRRAIGGAAGRDMLAYFHGLHRAYGTVMVAKNNRNLLVLSLLNDLFPNAFFVVARRDPAFVVASVLRANRDFFGDESILWGLKPYPDFPDRATGDPLEAVCRQHHELEKVIAGELAKIPAERVAIVDYELFCADPTSHLEDINVRVSSILGIPRKPLRVQPTPVAPSERHADSALRARINVCLARLERDDAATTGVRCGS